nr:MAG TPA: hypothetical protein [Microviridae sp.]
MSCAFIDKKWRIREDNSDLLRTQLGTSFN